MNYEDWRPRRNQSRWTKTAIRKMRRQILQGIDPAKPAHWLTTIEPGDTRQHVTLTLVEMDKLRGQITTS